MLTSMAQDPPQYGPGFNPARAKKNKVSPLLSLRIAALKDEYKFVGAQFEMLIFLDEAGQVFFELVNYFRRSNKSRSPYHRFRNNLR